MPGYLRWSGQADQGALKVTEMRDCGPAGRRIGAGGTHVGCRHERHDRGALFRARGAGTCRPGGWGAGARRWAGPAWRRTILDGIGNTPLIRVDGIWVKLEYLNPSGSMKARIAKYMVERAEREGLLRPGDTIVEASSGNTGNAMSMVAAVKGYRMLVVMPNGMSRERLAISRAFGARSDDRRLPRQRRAGQVPSWAARQVLRAAAVRLGVERRGEPDLARPGDPRQLPSGMVPDAVVGGVGTGGTIVGVGQASAR